MPNLLPSGAAVFSDSLSATDTTLLSLQTTVTLPQSAAMETATGMLLPDTLVTDRLRHFPEEFFNLRLSSHLVRFMNAVLGEAGAGQLRKRYLVARLQAAMSSTHFFDLDRFWGAIFGASRMADEVLGINPLLDTATPDEWDSIQTADAKYRTRLNNLASAIPLGATIPGLQTAAEAITGVDVDIYEMWAIIDRSGLGQRSAPGDFRTWFNMENEFPDWAHLEGIKWPALEVNLSTSGLELAPGSSANTWNYDEAHYSTWDDAENVSWVDLQGHQTTDPTGWGGFGRSPVPNRAEVVIRPKKEYPDTETGRRARAADEYQLYRVLNKLKPAGVLLTVDSDGLVMHTPIRPGRLSADSNYWEITTKTTPKLGLVKGAQEPYPVSTQQALAGFEPTQPHVVPVSVWSGAQDTEPSRNGHIASVTSYSLVAPHTDYYTLTQPDIPTGYPFSKANSVRFSDFAKRLGTTAFTLYLANPSIWFTNFGRGWRVGNKLRIPHGEEVQQKGSDYQTLRLDGMTVSYLPDWAIEPAAQVAAGQLVADGNLVAAPYSDTRKAMVANG